MTAFPARRVPARRVLQATACRGPCSRCPCQSSPRRRRRNGRPSRPSRRPGGWWRLRRPRRASPPSPSCPRCRRSARPPAAGRRSQTRRRCPASSVACTAARGALPPRPPQTPPPRLRPRRRPRPFRAAAPAPPRAGRPSRARAAARASRPSRGGGCAGCQGRCSGWWWWRGPRRCCSLRPRRTTRATSPPSRTCAGSTRGQHVTSAALGVPTAHCLGLLGLRRLPRLLAALHTLGPGLRRRSQGADLAASNQQAHGTPFRELVRALDRAEGGEALASLPGRGGFPHELEAEAAGAARTWGQMLAPPTMPPIAPPAVAAY